MLRHACLLLSLAVLASASTVTDTLTSPFTGGLFNGTVTVTCPHATSAGGSVIVSDRKSVTVVNGAFTINIQPYDTATPPNTCSVQYSSRDSAGRTVSWTEQWHVTASASPLSIKDVIVRPSANLPNIATICPYCLLGSQVYVDPPWLILSELGVSWKGDWSSSAAYALRDAVTYSGSSYLAIASSTNVTPGTDTTRWVQLAARGDPGPTGPPGVSETPYQTDITGTSISITAAAHSKGAWPVMSVYTGGILFPLVYDVDGSGNISVTGLPSATYHITIVGGIGAYIATFSGVTSIAISAATHAHGAFPQVKLFTSGQSIPFAALIDGSGNISITNLTSGTYTLKVF